jgi:transposase
MLCPTEGELSGEGQPRRNAKLTALRELVTPDRAILAVDLAPGKQAAVACDHDSVVVLGRRVFTGSAWCIEQIPAEPVAAGAGFAGLVLACEPARHQWEPLAVTAGEANL